MTNFTRAFIILLGAGLYSCSGFRPFDSESALKIVLNSPEQVVMGPEFWTGPEDCSSHAYLNKTPGGLLFTIEVFDDSIKTGETASYMNDGVELYFDMRPPRLRERNIYERGVFQAVILPEPGKKKLAPITWFPSGYETSIPGTIAYTELRDSGYVLQVSIPYSGLRRNHFWPRNSFYLDVAINDADTGARESQLMWRGKSDNWNKPHNFEFVSLEDPEEENNQKPNFLFIFTDQQTIKAMSAYGNPYLNTPNMDALARFGTRFTKSYCAAPASSPARSSMITGKMPHQTGVNYNDQAIDSSIENMGQFLRKAGYTCMWAGKWHLPVSYPHNSSLEVPGFKLIPFTEIDQISERGDFTDEPMADAVVKYLKGRKKEPFLLSVSFQNPHDIRYFPATMDIFRAPVNINAAPPLPYNFAIADNEPEFIRDSRQRTSYENEITFTTNFSESDWKNYLYQYYRMIEKVDGLIGKVIAALEKEGLDENTIIIFTSDHGDGAASHKWASDLSLYEESVKVPFILAKFGHDVQAKIDNKNLVSGLDILPTMMDYAGIKIPDGILGGSLRQIIENPDTAWREYLVSELSIDPEDPSKAARMITNGQYKYIQFSYGRNSEQLFNLMNDPGEKINLAGIEGFSGIKRSLKNALAEEMKDTKDTFLFK